MQGASAASTRGREVPLRLRHRYSWFACATFITMNGVTDVYGGGG